MARFDPSNSECLVFTYKDGLLSPIAHDLKLRVEDFTIDVTEPGFEIDAHFAAASIKVVAAMRDGQEAPQLLDDKERRTIEENLFRDVLRGKRFPEIRFRSTSVAEEGRHHRITGKLELVGRERPIGFLARSERGRHTVEAKIHQPDFGIRPYSAFLGTLRIKPDVLVRLSTPALPFAEEPSPEQSEEPQSGPIHSER